MTIDVRCATPNDSASACNVLHRSIVECCKDDHRDEATALNAWLHNKTPENMEFWIRSQQHFAVMAAVNGNDVGFALSTIHGEVLLCYLVPEARFMGVGKAMLIALEERALLDGIDTLRLESTSTARAFYLRNGFVETGQPFTAFGMQGFPMAKKLLRNILSSIR